ncbi:hypothetical protein SAMN04488066_13011 [Halorubrum aquaticum]|uniref:Uncharacterized protein n=1 Tax=Halorubrum aquaticum TaxID=387340 RepID=A0A1I3CV79_9EURY|nr:hypothetical protein [Halorubrum aquaticum]SFH78141.1 hypothetical protein SAMN04488066_13011 [Halorubrum aquaticum]
MVSTDDVKRALSALATRTDTATRPHAAVIDEADAARSDLRRAAGFVEAVGLDRLAAAVAEADRAGDAGLADRGREALEAYRRYRAVASGAEKRSDRPDRPDRSDRPDHPDHADRPGTPKPDTGQPSTR